MMSQAPCLLSTSASYTARPIRTNVCERIKQETGAYGAVIADVNDLKRAAVLGKSKGLDPNQIAQILIDNPFGNDNQKTPIVIIKNFTDVMHQS